VTRPRLTVRARLTALYALLVGASTGVLLLVSLWLLGRNFDRTLPAALAGDALSDVALQYALAFVGVLLLATVIGWAVAGRMLAPLKRITGTARRVSDESLAERIPVAGADDELRELGETLNGMLDRLEGSFQSQQRFVANASHELRSPLTVIRAEAEVALANPEPDLEELRGMAQAVVDASRRTETLLAGLLILARSQPDLLRSRPVDVEAAARSAVGEAEGAAAREGVRLQARLEPAAVEGDPALLERVAANLIENGIRYNRPGGFVEVSTRAGIATVELRVENSGPPIDAVAAARMTEPFERLGREADARGAGLGLSIVSAVSRAHGGSLSIVPRAGGGLVVSVRLPKAESRTLTAPPHRNAVAERHRLTRDGSPSLRSPSAPGSASGAETLASPGDPAYSRSSSGGGTS
jgi:signal transduction histidine kinase